ncbi:PAS domain-containing sensor histidine kinase [uncultured Draconibacterium sp.]|uniref:PAS domain-containing sensor histidine kinase n=1 Tax=uncultured Draconibacterium sp. TaxID=1573823 RepID=UPI0029C6C79C|nr:PAS domain-containing sensor histidine kinase [uncultured Draconibacterium sp.]
MANSTTNQNSGKRKSTPSAKEALITSEIRYRRLFESAKDGILILDAETGMIVDVNPFLIELLGYSKESFIEKTIWEIGFLKDIIDNKEKFLELQQKKYVRYEDLPLETADGRRIHVEFVSNVYLSDSQKVIQCNIRDITERKLSEATIINGKNMLRTLIDNLPAMIYIKDIECRKVIANITDIKNIGYQNEEEILGKTDIELFPGDIGQRGYADDQKVINLGIAINNRVEDFYNSEGKRSWISTTKIPLRNNEGEITGLVGIGYDITESKKIEEELTYAKEKAEESDRLKSAFLANMSHEIRTPMNGILGFTNLLQDPELTGEEQQEYIGIIQKSGDRMLNTVNDIINISKIEAGQTTVFVSEFNIDEQLKTIYSFFKPETDKKGIQFILKNSLTEQDDVIESDKEKLDSILTNLVKNAIKFCDKGKIEFGCFKKERGLQFYVKDSGIGIPLNRQQAIFERFIQADIDDKNALQGSGLGLAIAKAYTKMLGGKIWVESAEGQGSTFFFNIAYKSNKVHR